MSTYIYELLTGGNEVESCFFDCHLASVAPERLGKAFSSDSLDKHSVRPSLSSVVFSAPQPDGISGAITEWRFVAVR